VIDWKDTGAALTATGGWIVTCQQTQTASADVALKHGGRRYAMVTAINLSAPICRQHFFQCTAECGLGAEKHNSRLVTKFGSKPN
jgi:hypothetical protein